jgi:predicted phosphodiesterase
MSKEFVLLADIHGNASALQAVVEREGRDKEYIVLGDIHGLNSYPKETLNLVQELSGPKLSGNHDKAIFQYGEGHVNSPELSAFELRHTLSNLSGDYCRYMLSLPHLDVIEQGGQRICLTHAMPWPEMASGYEAGNAGIGKWQVTEIASTVTDDYDWVFHGHTHQQYDLDTSKFAGLDVHFVNPGSLGYDDSYTVVDVDANAVSHKSVEGAYDRDALREHVQAHLPDGAPHTKEWF